MKQKSDDGISVSSLLFVVHEIGGKCGIWRPLWGWNTHFFARANFFQSSTDCFPHPLRPNCKTPKIFSTFFKIPRSFSELLQNSENVSYFPPKSETLSCFPQKISGLPRKPGKIHRKTTPPLDQNSKPNKNVSTRDPIPASPPICPTIPDCRIVHFFQRHRWHRSCAQTSIDSSTVKIWTTCRCLPWLKF